MKNDQAWVNISTERRCFIGVCMCEMNRGRKEDKTPPPVKYAPITKNVL